MAINTKGLFLPNLRDKRLKVNGIGSPALRRLSSPEGRGEEYSKNVYTGRILPEVPDLVPSFIYPLQTSAHMYRLIIRAP